MEKISTLSKYPKAPFWAGWPGGRCWVALAVRSAGPRSGHTNPKNDLRGPSSAQGTVVGPGDHDSTLEPGNRFFSFPPKSKENHNCSQPRKSKEKESRISGTSLITDRSFDTKLTSNY